MLDERREGMNFSTPKAVLDCIHAGDDVARIRGENRVKVNNAANGFPPLSADEADKMGMNVNTSFLDLPILLATARRQYTRNFNGTKQFFRISIPNAPAEDQTDWSLFMGGFINRVLKKSRSYFFLGQNRWTALVAHGIAPQLWWDNECWLPKFVPIEDWRVPTDTDTSLDNLPWFAVRIASTEGELTDKVFGEFAGYDIVYNTLCAGLGNTKVENIQVSQFTTDVQFVMQNPTPSSPAVSDEGFVLMACDEHDGIITESPLQSNPTNTLNNTFIVLVDRLKIAVV